MNQCQFEYNNFGQLITKYQSHDRAVNVSTTPQVGYTYADGSNNMIRQTGLVYPNGRFINSGEWDLIVIDGDHSASAVLQDATLALLRPNGWLLFDDVRPNRRRQVADGLHQFLSLHASQVHLAWTYHRFDCYEKLTQPALGVHDSTDNCDRTNPNTAWRIAAGSVSQESTTACKSASMLAKNCGEPLRQQGSPWTPGLAYPTGQIAAAVGVSGQTASRHIQKHLQQLLTEDRPS